MRNLWRKLLPAALVAMTASSTLVSPAVAFPHDDNWGCDEPDGSVFFKNDGIFGSSWSSSEKQTVMDAIEGWNELRARDGRQFITFTESAFEGPDTIRLIKDDLAPINGAGGCDVSGLLITLDRIMVENNPTKTAVVVQHEAGHILELDHTGRYDNYDGISSPLDPPIMSTCANSSWTDTRTISNDDAAQMSDRLDSTSTIDRVTANPSFEDHLAGWEKLSVGRGTATATISGVGSYLGHRHLRFKHDPGGSRVQNVTRVANAAGRTFDAQGRFKRESSSHTGEVTMTLVYRNVEYGPHVQCSYVQNVSMNDVTPDTWWRAAGSANQTIGTDNWHYVSIPSVVASTAHDAIDLGILLYSSVNSCSDESNSSCRVHVKADDIYVSHQQ